MSPCSLKRLLKQEEDVIEGLKECSIVVPHVSVRKLAHSQVLLQAGFLPCSQPEIEIVKELETPRSDTVTIGHGHPGSRHVASCSPVRLSMVLTGRIHLQRQGEDSLSISAALGTHPPDINWQELLTAVLTGIVHVNVLSQCYHLGGHSELPQQRYIWEEEKDNPCDKLTHEQAVPYILGG